MIISIVWHRLSTFTFFIASTLSICGCSRSSRSAGPTIYPAFSSHSCDEYQRLEEISNHNSRQYDFHRRSNVPSTDYYEDYSEYNTQHYDDEEAEWARRRALNGWKRYSEGQSTIFEVPNDDPNTWHSVFLDDSLFSIPVIRVSVPVEEQTDVQDVHDQKEFEQRPSHTCANQSSSRIDSFGCNNSATSDSYTFERENTIKTTGSVVESASVNRSGSRTSDEPPLIPTVLPPVSSSASYTLDEVPRKGDSVAPTRSTPKLCTAVRYVAIVEVVDFYCSGDTFQIFAREVEEESAVPGQKRKHYPSEYIQTAFQHLKALSSTSNPVLARGCDLWTREPTEAWRNPHIWSRADLELPGAESIISGGSKCQRYIDSADDFDPNGRVYHLRARLMSNPHGAGAIALRIRLERRTREFYPEDD
jgi:hypothetical protein